MPTAIKFPLCLLSYGNDIGDRMNKIISYSIVNGAGKLPDEMEKSWSISPTELIKEHFDINN